jgi:hypothetical protein
MQVLVIYSAHSGAPDTPHIELSCSVRSESVDLPTFAFEALPSVR